MADTLKAEGNKLFQEKKFAESIDKFTEAIKLDPKNHVLYSNRSGSYASLKDFKNALDDAEKTIEIKPDWPKGYTRKATAMHGQGDLPGAYKAYEEALKIDPSSAQAKSGLENIKRSMEAESNNSNPMQTFSNAFKDPNLIAKLAGNPKTAPLLSDPDFMMKLQRIQQNPQGFGAQDLQDPRFLQVFGVLMGLDMSFSDRSPPGATSASQAEPEDEEMPDAPPTKPTPPPTKKQPEPEPEQEPEDEEALAQREAKSKAEEEKKLGTENYKKRQFDAAIEHYSKAWDFHKDITYLNNLGAAYFEKGDLEKCIETCKKAVEEGRQAYADFKLVAKAFGRIGTAYEKQGKLPEAIENYEKALTENRTPDILTKLRAAQKAQSLAAKNAAVDPAKAEEARELGNQKFKEADWPAAVEAYTEMIKRAPQDARGYSNRAACLIKLVSFPAAVQDCDEAIKRDPKFVRAYLRKAQALFAMREYNKCIDACVDAAENDEGGKNTREIQEQQQKAIDIQFSSREGETEEQASARIQKDPEIMAILNDPIMQTVLNQAKGDPNALREHMKNPKISVSVQKLVAAGVIRLGR